MGRGSDSKLGVPMQTQYLYILTKMAIYLWSKHTELVLNSAASVENKACSSNEVS